MNKNKLDIKKYKDQRLNFYGINVLAVGILILNKVLNLGAMAFMSAGGASEKIPEFRRNQFFLGFLIILVAVLVSIYKSKYYISIRKYGILLDIPLILFLGGIVGVILMFFL